MKEKNLEITILLDYYGGVLTEKQREVIELYYEDDLSLSEIAEHSGITRQGVRDAIKRGENTMLELEEHLGFVRKMEEYEKRFLRIRELNREVEQFNRQNVYSRYISEHTREINQLTEEESDGI